MKRSNIHLILSVMLFGCTILNFYFAWDHREVLWKALVSIGAGLFTLFGAILNREAYIMYKQLEKVDKVTDFFKGEKL